MKKSLILAVLLLAPAAASSQESAPVQMAPVSVKAGPLGCIGISCSVDVGMLGLVSNNAHIKGLVIAEVFKDSAAQRAGLLPADRILKIDGVPITTFSINSLRNLGQKEKGDLIELIVLSPNANAPRSVQVTLGARKAQAN
jgi:C-terminal processing protease CtpA/Prc